MNIIACFLLDLKNLQAQKEKKSNKHNLELCVEKKFFQQKNITDCGIIMLKAIDYCSQNIEPKRKFGQKDVQIFRN